MHYMGEELEGEKRIGREERMEGWKEGRVEGGKGGRREERQNMYSGTPL